MKSFLKWDSGAALFLVGALFLCGTPAFASDQNKDTDHTKALSACQRALKAQKTLANGKSAQIGAEYTPGVDVYGNKVAPADTQSSVRIDPPAIIEFDVTYDVAKRLGMNSSGLYKGEAPVARVRIEGQDLYINGKKVYGPSSADFIAACRQAVDSAK